MQVQVKGKQVDVGDSLRDHAEATLSELVGKYFDRAIDADVVLSKDGKRFKVDISVHPLRGLTVQASAGADEAYAAFEAARERVAKQLRRYKRRLLSNKTRPQESDVLPALQYVLAPEPEEEAADEGDAPVIVAETPADIPTCTVGGAVMRLDLSNQPVVMFKNSAHGGLNLVYRRADGHIGWIDPQALERAKGA